MKLIVQLDNIFLFKSGKSYRSFKNVFVMRLSCGSPISHTYRLRGYDIVFVSRLLGQKSLLYFSLHSSSPSHQAITATSFPHELFKAIIPPPLLLSRLREQAKRIKCTERFRVERGLELFAGRIKASRRKR